MRSKIMRVGSGDEGYVVLVDLHAGPVERFNQDHMAPLG
jgi:hypothetical protein